MGSTKEEHEEAEKVEPVVNPTDDVESQKSLGLQRVSSRISTHDAVASHDRYHEQGDEVYQKFSSSRKKIIVVVVAFCGLLSPISSTSVVSAAPEVVSTYHTTGTIFNLSNALYLFFMGLSPLVYGPASQAFGRKPIMLLCAVTFTVFSIATAVAPNLASYFVFRILTAFQGTSFLIVGSTVIGDIYAPVERGTAYSFFSLGTLVGPAFGPFIAGLIVTYQSWRVIFYFQGALAAVGTLAIFFLLPETIHQKRSDELAGLTKLQKAGRICSWMNPIRVVTLLLRPNLLIVGLASSALTWNMYALLTPIRYVLNPAFNLTSPLQSGLFYLAPGFGYLFGALFGGRWADRVVKKNIDRRGVRIPEDRLRSALTNLGLVTPACMLIYGWSIEKQFGGIALPVITMFIQGVAQLFCFPSLNTYCLDVMPGRSSEVVASNYFLRYTFAAAASAACLPMIEGIGVGWTNVVSAVFVMAAAGGVLAVTIIWGHRGRITPTSNVNSSTKK